MVTIIWCFSRSHEYSIWISVRVHCSWDFQSMNLLKLLFKIARNYSIAKEKSQRKLHPPSTCKMINCPFYQFRFVFFPFSAFTRLNVNEMISIAMARETKSVKNVKYTIYGSILSFERAFREPKKGMKRRHKKGEKNRHWAEKTNFKEFEKRTDWHFKFVAGDSHPESWPQPVRLSQTQVAETKAELAQMEIAKYSDSGSRILQALICSMARVTFSESIRRHPEILCVYAFDFK